MSEPCMPQLEGHNTEDDSDMTPPKKEAHLTLVVSNPLPFQQEQPAFSKSPRPDIGFYVEIHKKNRQVYKMKAQDPSHYLECHLKLEILKSCCDKHGGGVICHFSNIADETFNAFIEEDATLYGALMIQFQMRIMEELLIFCADHEASGLIIYMDGAQAKDCGIYENILVHQDKTFTKLGEKTVMVIPTDRDTFDKWAALMQDVNHRLHQVLWVEQKLNPAIRTYLKSQRVH